VLAGFMGTGKTTVGRILADRYGLDFVDLDDEITARTRRTPAEIIRQDGEEAFREHESKVLADLAPGHGRVVALGGGTILADRNRQLLADKYLVCLTASVETLHERIRTGPDRPLLDGGGALRRLLETRRSVYDTLMQVDTDGRTPEGAADAVADALGLPAAVVPFTRHTKSAIYVRSGAAAELASLLGAKKPGRCLIVTDDNVAAHGHAERVASSLRDTADVATVIIPAGEAYKSAQSIHAAYQEALEFGLQRSDLVVGVGGGVVCDLAGFVAATYMRGTMLALVPTTLLAQADAAIGGKVGFDFGGIKNLIGAFYPATVVAIDSDTLATLPSSELAWGAAEIIKIALMCSPSLVADLRSLGGLEALVDGNSVIKQAARLKADVVRADPFERGERMLLNFGHTVGHALEAASEYRLPHGAAVAIGMSAEVSVARTCGWTESEVGEILRELLDSFELPARAPDLDAAVAVHAMGHDKKRTGDSVTLAVPERIGRGTLRALALTDLSSALGASPGVRA